MKSFTGVDFIDKLGHKQKYRIKFYSDKILVRQTIPRFHSYEFAEHYLKNILKFRYYPEHNKWSKRGLRAEIVCENGIPF